MRLEIESVDIEDIQAGSKTYAHNHVMYINPREVEELILKDRRIRSVDINLVNPGDRVRIINLMDVVQPRCNRFTSIPGPAGTYRGVLRLKTNYPEKPEITIPIRARFRKGDKG